MCSYAWDPSRIKKIKVICNKHNIYLIEDTAWGCEVNWIRKIGNWGDIGPLVSILLKR